MLNGIDIASHQHDLDLSKLTTDFVIIKATGGIDYTNPYCDKHFQQALKLGLKIGFYHYANEYDVKNDPIKEAKFFVDSTRNYFGKGIPVLDFEASSVMNDPSWAKQFLDYVYQQTGVRPLLYTYSYVVNQFDFSSIFKSNYGLWIANYGMNNLEYSFRKPYPPISNGNPVTVMYQYSSNTILSGFSRPLDVNVFYGDKSTWDKYVKGEKGGSNIPETYPPTKPEEKPNNVKGGIKMKTLTTSVDKLRLRSEPNTSNNNNIIMGMKKGTPIDFDDLINVNGYLWAIQPRNDKTKGYVAICESKHLNGTVK